jgi:uncharacterized repeat protein (TIGR03803 family)
MRPISFQRRLGCAALLAGIFSAVSASAIPQVAMPVFSPAAGTYAGAQSVTISSATPGAMFAFTTDSSIPTESGGTITHGTLYSGAIAISSTTALSAIAFKSGQADSAVSVAGYTVQSILPLNVLYNFSASNHGGINPYAGLVQGVNNNFYGMTYQGGADSAGTIFSVTPAGALTTLVSFTSANAANNSAGLIQGRDGNLYGTTSGDGINSFGTVFKMTLLGSLTTLVTFDGTEGTYPQAALIRDAFGNLYGTTASGGSDDVGTVFALNPATGFGDYYTSAILASFGGGTDGSYPEAGLVQGSDLNFYGTTSSGGGSTNAGTVFRISSTGTLTILVSFTGANGATPDAALMQGSDGNFYGTTTVGGSANDGTVFKLAVSGGVWTLTTLVSFDGTDGSTPESALLQANDGNFYGTTYDGGSSNGGTVFRMTPAGVLTTLVSFNGTNGAYPYAGLVQGTDGNLYGTTYYGGSSNQGVIFQLVMPGSTPTLPPPPTASSGGGGAPGWWFLGFLVSAGILRWKFRKAQAHI